jgi:hypothetical protein
MGYSDSRGIFLGKVLPMPEDQGTLEHILHILSYLDRPRNALAVGTENLLDDDPNTGFWQGAYSGLMGEKERSWADLAGMERPQPTDEWLPWLGKGAVHLGGDAILDPLLFLGPLSKLGKAGKLGTGVAKGLDYLGTPWRAASESIHGSPIGRAFAQGVPKHLESVFEEPLNAAVRQRQEALDPVMKLFEQGKALESGVDDMAAARQAWERPFMESQAPPELEGVWKELWRIAKEKKDEVNALAESQGIKPIIGELSENDLYSRVPLIATAQARRYLNRAGLLERGGRKMSPESFQSRELMTMADPEALKRGVVKPILSGGRPVVTKLDHPLSGYDAATGMLTRGGEQIPASPVTATLQDITQSGLIPDRSFVKSVTESYLIDIMRKENQKAFLTHIAKGIDQGKWIKRIDTIQDIPKDWRQVKVRGMENYAAPRWAANEMEKRAKTMFDPDTPLGMLEQLGSAALNTRLGGLLQEGTRWWKRNVLGLHFGYYLGNAISDMPQMYMGGVDAWMIPFRKAQAIAVQAGRGSNIFSGLTNRQLGEEFARRGLWSTTWGSSEAGDAIDKAINEGFLRRNLGHGKGVSGTVGRGVVKVGETWGKLNEVALRRFGGNIEANSRIGVAIDWLKREGIKAPTPEDLDRAALFANKAMIDYSALTPFERQLATIIPFIAWQRGILGRTAESVVESPERLARLGRTLDMIFEPMPESERQISDDWIKENAPTMGAFGTSWDESLQRLNDLAQRLGVSPETIDKYGFKPLEGGPRMALAGRFLPHTQVEQLMNRPLESLVSAINPLLKGPAELMANYSSFKDRPIDELNNFPANLGTSGQMATQSPFGLRLPASWDYIMSQMPGGRTVNALSELGRGAGLWSDPYKAESSPSEALSSYATGGKFYPFDRNKQLFRRKMEADKKARTLTHFVQYAWARGDNAGVEHYMRALQEHQAKVQRALGFVQGGE